MAIESVVANSGTGGAKFATDQITEGADTLQVPYTKLMAGADASKELIGGDAANGLDVDVTRLPALPAGTNNIGDVDVLTLPAVTNAGTFAVQESGAALTALQLSDDVVHSGDAAVSKYALIGAVLDDTAPATVTENQAQSLRMTSARGLHVSVRDAIPAGTNNIGDVDVLTVPAPLSTTGGGTEAAALRVTLATDSTGVVSVDDNGASLTVDGTVTANLAAGTNNIGDVDVLTLPALPAGTNNIGDVDVLTIAAGDNNIGNVDVVTLPALVAGTANIGDVDVLTLPAIPTGTNSIGRVNPEPQTANGLSISRTLSAASTNATSVKASAGQVYTIYAHNINAAVRYLKIYNKASAPTVGTDTPVLTLPIPGNAAGAGFALDTGGMGIAFATGIALALTTGIADADTGAVAANEIVINLLYK